MTHSQSEEQKKQRRRDILKAVAGAPVLFTLPTGAAVAAVSITCKNKSATLFNNSTVALTSTSADTWVRFKVQRQSIRITNKNNGSQDDVSNAFTLDNINWYRVNNNNGVVTKVNLLTRTVTPLSPVAGQFYYLLVDHTKYLSSSITSPQSFVYLGADQSVAAPIAGGSCWNSITPGGQVPTSNILN